MIASYVRLHINTGDNYKLSMEKGWICRDNIEITAVIGIYEVPVSDILYLRSKLLNYRLLHLVKLL
jgi:hypothetical protein